MSVKLYFNGREHDVSPGRSLFEYAEEMGINVPTSCRKNGKCKECVVEVGEGMGCLSKPTLPEAHLRGVFRLSCQTQIIADAGAVQCHTMRRGDLRIERHAFELPTHRESWSLDPAVTRDGDRILLDGKEIERSTGPIYGVAVDCGTTTVVLRLLNLETGEILADSSFENPQRFGGSDVMSRIQYDSDDGSKVLQRTMLGYLEHAIEELPVNPQSIYEIVVAGNSTMRDLFFGLSVHSIGQSPYRSSTELDVAEGIRSSTSLSRPAKRLGIPVHPKARVYGLPIVSGHVGADASACMLAVNLAEEERTVAIMDIGTNTELIIGNKDRILAASCPAGPAFEGGNIACGMPGLPGAIERVYLDEAGEMRVTVIGDLPPQGICGSGMIDLLSVLLETGRINALGRFEDEEDPIVIDHSAPVPVTFSESDINELAQAKGANVAGLRTIFAEYNLSLDELDRFYLAGGFGRHLDVDRSKRIGLIPNVDNDRIVQVGNAAIEGACIALLSKAKRDQLERLIGNVKHCRLETHPDFFDFFAFGCQFAPMIDNPLVWKAP